MGDDLFSRFNMHLSRKNIGLEQRERDDDHFNQLVDQRKRMLYEVKDVQDELEELTDDEEEIKT